MSLFVDGQRFACTDEAAWFAEQLCANDRLTIDPDVLASEPTMELIVELCCLGCVAFVTD